MATPNNFKVTDAIGSTDNFAGAEVKFFHITLIQDDSSALDIRTELDFDGDCSQFNKNYIATWHNFISENR